MIMGVLILHFFDGFQQTLDDQPQNPEICNGSLGASIRILTLCSRFGKRLVLWERS